MKYIQLFNKRVIQRTEGVPYLHRWTLLGLGRDSNLFSIKVHKIVANDDHCLHDHPWKFISIVLKGGYFEWTDQMIKTKQRVIWQPKGPTSSQYCRWYGPGSILIRNPLYAHRLELKTDQFGYDNVICWTLVFTFKKVRGWGFFTKMGWIPWYKYKKDQHC